MAQHISELKNFILNITAPSETGILTTENSSLFPALSARVSRRKSWIKMCHGEGELSQETGDYGILGKLNKFQITECKQSRLQEDAQGLPQKCFCRFLFFFLRVSFRYLQSLQLLLFLAVKEKRKTKTKKQLDHKIYKTEGNKAFCKLH